MYRKVIQRYLFCKEVKFNLSNYNCRGIYNNFSEIYILQRTTKDFVIEMHTNITVLLQLKVLANKTNKAIVIPQCTDVVVSNISYF